MSDSSKLHFEEQGKNVWLVIDAKCRKSITNCIRNPQAVDLDFENQDDLWFMEQHQQFRKEEQEKKQEALQIKENKKKVNEKKGSKGQPKIIKNIKSKTERSKSEKSQRVDKVMKIPPPPCMFSTRIQRAWQEKSRRRWYDLSAKSRKVAESEMRQLSASSLDDRKKPIKTHTNVRQFRPLES